MKISNRTKLPEWIAVRARRAPVFAGLIRSHPEVAGRLHAPIRFRETKPRLPVAQAAQAVGRPQSTLYAREGRFDGDPSSLADRSRRRKTVPQRTARTLEARAAILDMRTRFARGIEKLRKTLRRAGHQIAQANVGRVVQELLANGEIEPIRFRKNPEARKSAQKRNRKPRHGKRGIPAEATVVGQLIKMDTMHVGLPGGGKIY